ncbi:MAG TPA: transglycosylase domain-containing protein [Cellulomonas sp.]|uniref:transglycosylase domain-containing protein n=1 Tax=Cellulomonas sp. TaxID=40001 RepID=UPI002E369A19|nr:transglycosylase domain-containing protein [Cellulomonas sp.]HEX5332523.1 transglycosylase domain-containing protein [Cellulomonas sp.]
MAYSPRARGRQVNAFQALALLLSFALIAVVGGVLVGAMVLPAVAVVNGTTNLAVTTFDNLPTELAMKPLSEKSTMLAADGSVLATFYAENRVVVPIADIAPIMQNAVIATEDKRFYEHGGIDPTGMLRAGVRNILNPSATEGASTLTQQFVKNTLIEAALQSGDFAAAAAAKEAKGAEGYSRKLREAKLAIALEKTTPKQTILEGYLNIAQFGINLYGIESAANHYFGKHASELNYMEAATLAGVTQSPTKWDPAKNTADSETRRNVVLRLLKEQGYITVAEYTAGVATPLASMLHVQDTKVGCMAASAVVPGSGYFCDYVTKVIASDPAFGATQTDRINLLYRGGLTITTTIDPRQQAIADAEVKAGVPVDDPSGVGSAISVVEPGTGKITAMAQNRNYTATLSQVAGETAVNYNTDQAYGGSTGFQPGSTFKPFTLVEWLKQGHSLNETVDGTVKPLNENMFTTCGAKGPNVPWKPGNAEGNGHQMSVLQATMNSVNLAYLDMAKQLDMCNIMAGAKDLGVHTGTGKDPSTNPSNVIGTDTIAPLTMAAAFATFATGGTYCAPIAITSVRDSGGKELAVPQAGCRQALEPRIANAVNYALSNVWQGTAKGVPEPPFTSAGKTGTTSHNEQTWFVAYTPVLAAAVWVGEPDQANKRMQDMTINGKRYYTNHQVYGSSIAAPTWSRFMTQALAGVSVPGFAAVGTLELNGAPITVPNVVGQSVDAATATLQGAGFKVSVAPDQIASTVPAGSVAAQSPGAFAKATKGSVITLQLSNGQPPAPAVDPNAQVQPVQPAPQNPNPGKGKG